MVKLNNKIFLMPKFRTMRTGTPIVATHLLSNSHLHLTVIGGFLRRSSLDELPQLFNVLNGSMNLIGPRPSIPDEVEEYEDRQLRRLSMKPGITGLWQVSGRNKIKEFNDWVKIDLEYIDNWSFLLDFRIAVKTVSTVLSGTGM